MGSLFAKDFLDNCLANIGAVCGKTNEFSAELDSVNYFNGKKNGVANSCSIFLCDMTYRSTRDADLEICPDKWDAYYFLYQPSNPSENCGAGCTQQVGYFKDGGAFFTDSSEAERGDWIFFSSDGGETFYHVGAIYDWGFVEELGTDGFTTIEGNTNGGYVAFHYYRYDDSRIGGFGRPRYDGWELPTAEKEPDKPKEDPKPIPEPEPIPEPTPEPTVKLYRVRTNGSPLRLRSAPNTDSACLELIPNGTVIGVPQFVDGEMINWNESWARTTYNGVSGYCSANYLVEE